MSYRTQKKTKFNERRGKLFSVGSSRPFVLRDLIRFSLLLFTFAVFACFHESVSSITMAEPVSKCTTESLNNQTLPKIQTAKFGTLDSGEAVHKFTITNANNAQASFIEYGARWIEMSYADNNGQKSNVLVGFEDLAGNVKDKNYMGATVGRYAMRIKPPAFTLDGKEYKLEENRPGLSLHGGLNAYDKKVWKGQVLPSGVLFQRISEDGENGYPGRLLCTVLYQLNDQNEVVIDVGAKLMDVDEKSDKKKVEGKNATIVNIFNHAYFNLAGKPGKQKLYDHQIAIHSDTVATFSSPGVADDLVALDKMPTKVFDLRQLGNYLTEERLLKSQELQDTKGYDNSWLMQHVDAARVNNKQVHLKLAATVVHPPSGRKLEVLTTQPFIHLYSGGFLNPDVRTTDGRVYDIHSGFCLETCNVGNAPNNPKMPSAVLREGESYAHRSVYRFGLI